MSLRKRIIINAGSNWACTLITAVLGIILVPVILSYLGTVHYGVWVLLASVLSYVVILNRALTLAINRFVAFYHDDKENRNRFISASFLILAGMGVITVIAAIPLSFIIPDIFTAIPQEVAFEAQITFILVSLTLAVKMISANFGGALQGYQSYVRYNIITIIGQVLRMILTIIFLVIWRSIVALQSAFLIAMVVNALLMYFVAQRTIKGLKVDFRLVNREALLVLWRYTSHSLVRSGSSIVMYSTLILLVGWRGTATDVTVYDLAFKFPGFIRGLLASTQVVFLPAVTMLCVKREFGKIRSLVLKGTHMMSVLTFGLLILLFTLAGAILNVWLRGNVPSGTVDVMRILIISVIPG